MPREVDPEFIETLEHLAEAWERGLVRDTLLSHERKQTYGHVVRQFIKWVREGQGRVRLPRV